ncbi:preprotein translocase subunit SecA [Paenibacillus mucilaginosus]
MSVKRPGERPGRKKREVGARPRSPFSLNRHKVIIKLYNEVLTMLEADVKRDMQETAKRLAELRGSL